MKVLLVAGDTDGWHHMHAVADAVLALHGQPVVLRGADMRFIYGNHTIAIKTEDKLEGQVKSVIRNKDVDTVLMVTSRRGVDPLTDAVLRNSAVLPIHVIQEYWGDVVTAMSDMKQPYTYLVRDTLAASVTAPRVGGTNIHVTGSPKYAWFERLDIMMARRKRRQELGLNQWDDAIGWFGQAPADQSAYMRTLRAFVSAVVVSRKKAMIVYRPHSRESEAQIRQTAALFAEAGAIIATVRHGELWEWLAMVDGVFSCFSNCCADAVHLNCVAPEPLNRAVFLMFDQGLKDYYLRVAGNKEPPLSTQKLALQVSSIDELVPTIEAALDPLETEAAWTMVRQHIIRGTHAAAAVCRVMK